VGGGARRGIVTAGSWCVDYNKSIADWPAEDTSNEVLAVDRQGGGSACNMALDLKRLDPDLPVETMGVVGDDDEARFLFAQCDAAGVERAGLLKLSGGATMTVDAFNVKSNGRRTHFYHPGVAATMSPEHFDFSRSNAKILHLGLPGAHKRMDSPWRGEANGWVVTLAAARREGIVTNLELMTTGRERIAALARPCLPHLDLLIVNDFEIGAVAEMETRRGGKADPPAIRVALAAALRLGAMRLAVVHFPEGAIALTRDGAAFALGSVAAPRSAIAGVNGAGDAFAAGVLYALHEERGVEDALRLGHACAAASMRAVSTTTGVGSVAECLALADQWGLRPPPA
jgi:sugar/nucleoside kinase (ribokinase family)